MTPTGTPHSGAELLPTAGFVFQTVAAHRGHKFVLLIHAQAPRQSSSRKRELPPVLGGEKP
jgi:hypothetical protein